MKTKLLMLTVASALLSTNAFAVVTASGNLNLSGTISDAVSINVVPSGNHNNLPLSTTQVDRNVASVEESSNATAGYLVKARSTNASKLVHTTDSGQFVNYTMKYAGGAAVTLTAVDQTVKTQNTGGVYTSVASAVTISYTGVAAASLRSGSYTDTITFTVESQ